MATERVLCFMTMHEFFDFFYYALNTIKNTFCFPTTIKDIKTQNEIINMTEKGQSILTRLYTQEVSVYKKIIIPSFKGSDEKYIYSVPDFDSLRKSTISFCCPLLFDALDLNAFIELLISILTERSILFVSEDLNLLSSSV